MKRIRAFLVMLHALAAAVICTWVPWTEPRGGLQVRDGYAPIWAPPPVHFSTPRPPLSIASIEWRLVLLELLAASALFLAFFALTYVVDYSTAAPTEPQARPETPTESASHTAPLKDYKLKPGQYLDYRVDPFETVEDVKEFERMVEQEKAKLASSVKPKPQLPPNESPIPDE